MNGEVVRHDHHHRQGSKQLNIGLSFRRCYQGVDGVALLLLFYLLKYFMLIFTIIVPTGTGAATLPCADA